VLIVWIIFTIIITLVDPIRRSEESVTSHILRLTPIGTHIEDVIETLQNYRNWDRHWHISRVSYELGFPHPRPHTIIPIPEDSFFVVGEKSIIGDTRYWPAHLLPPGLFMEAIVSIFWGFDEDGKLIEVYVWKSFR